MAMIGATEMLLLVLMSAAGQPTDLVSLLSPQDYFQTRGIDATPDKLVELAAKDPVDGAGQLGQLLALRSLGQDVSFKKAANNRALRSVIEDIAAGKKAQDKTGFAKEYAQRALAQLDGAQPPSRPAAGARADGLAWFPASATFVAGLESRPSAMPAPTSLTTQILKNLPPELKKEFYRAAEGLGNIRIDRFTLAVIDADGGKARIYLRLTGRFNPAWLVAMLKKTGMEAKESQQSQGTSVVELGRAERSPAIAVIGDRDFVVAGTQGGDRDEAVLAEVLRLRAKGNSNAATGPIKAYLDKIPAQAIGYLAGAFPEGLRQDASRSLGAFPKSTTAYLVPTPTGLGLHVNGAMENAEQAKTLVETTSNLRMKALEALEKPPPMPIPGINIGEIKDMFKSLQIEAQGDSVHLRMQLSNDALSMLPLWLFPVRAEVRVPAQPVPNAQPAPKK
jgi:hypothetical protein